MKYWFIRESTETVEEVKDILKTFLLKVFNNNPRYLNLLNYVDLDFKRKRLPFNVSALKSWMERANDNQLITLLIDGMHGGVLLSTMLKGVLTKNSHTAFFANLFKEYRSFLQKQTKSYLENIITESTCFIQPIYNLMMSWLDAESPIFVDKYLYLKEMENHAVQEYDALIFLSKGFQVKMNDFYPCFKEEIDDVYQRLLRTWDVVVNNTKRMKDFPQQLLMKWGQIMHVNEKFQFLAKVKHLESAVADRQYELAVNQAKELLR